MQNCKTYRTEIEEVAEGSALSRGARAHLEACRACEEVYRRSAALRGLLGGLEQVSAPDDFEFRLRARMAEARGPEARRPFLSLRFASGFASIALAACFLAVVGALYLRDRRDVTQSRAARAGVQNEVARVSPPPADKPSTEPPSAETKTVAQTEDPTHLTARATTHRRAREAGKSHAPARDARAEDFSVRPANVIVGNAARQQVASAGQTVAIPLSASAETMRVVLRDESGAARVLPMRSVSFGAQNLVTRNVPAARPSLTVKEGVW